MGTAIRSCSRLIFFEAESAHCTLRGAVKISFLLLSRPRAGSNLRPTSPRNITKGTRIWSHCSRRFLARSRSKGVACSAFRCSRVRGGHWQWEHLTSHWKTAELLQALLLQGCAERTVTCVPNSTSRFFGVLSAKLSLNAHLDFWDPFLSLRFKHSSQLRAYGCMEND
jgi:hypothetical protein